MVREIIYGTVDRSTFIQIKGAATAAAVWKKLHAIHADKGSLFETDLLTQLQTIRYSDGDSMRTHLTKMTELCDRLAEIGAPITDASFNSYIRSSLSLTSRYQPLFTPSALLPTRLASLSRAPDLYSISTRRPTSIAPMPQ